jgi:hypothetical protein
MFVVYISTIIIQTGLPSECGGKVFKAGEVCTIIVGEFVWKGEMKEIEDFQNYVVARFTLISIRENPPSRTCLLYIHIMPVNNASPAISNV